MELPHQDDQIIFRATDKRGHYSQIRVAIPPEIAQMLETLMQTRQNLPYRTKTDVVRDALFHRLAWLQANRDMDFGEGLHRLKAVDRILDREEGAIEFEKRIQRLKKVIDLINDEQEASNLVNEIANEVRHMPQGYWKTRYLSYLNDRYSHLLKPWSMGDIQEEQ